MKDDVLSVGFLYEDTYVVVPAEEIGAHDGFKAWLENADTEKVVYDAKKTYVAAHRIDVQLRGITFDIMLASYIIDPSKTIDDVHSVVTEFGVHYVPEAVNVYGKGKKRQVPEHAELNHYLGLILSAIHETAPHMHQTLTEHQQLELLEALELPLASILSEMEEVGIYTDKATLQKMEAEIQEKLDRLIADIHEAAGETFNINSPKQLGVILFETLELPVIKKTKTGYSTAVDVLEQLQGEHPIIDYILEYRQLSKLQSTYVEGLQKVISDDGRIHTRFNQTLAQTGLSLIHI